jgi:hypothetical protein
MYRNRSKTLTGMRLISGRAIEQGPRTAPSISPELQHLQISWSYSILFIRSRGILPCLHAHYCFSKVGFASKNGNPTRKSYLTDHFVVTLCITVATIEGHRVLYSILLVSHCPLLSTSSVSSPWAPPPKPQNMYASRIRTPLKPLPFHPHRPHYLHRRGQSHHHLRRRTFRPTYPRCPSCLRNTQHLRARILTLTCPL